MRCAAIILGAGRSSRFGAGHKLLVDFHGAPMIAHAVAAARKAGLAEIILVTGHEAALVAAAAGPGIHVAHNPDFAEGIASSIKVGMAALSPEIDGALIMLGDMPLIREETLKAILAMARHAPLIQAVFPVQGGRRGNPVLIRRRLFPLFSRLEGDQGARKLLESAEVTVLECPVEDAGIHADFDTKEMLILHSNNVSR